MPNTTYVFNRSLQAADRPHLYRRLADFFLHLEALGEGGAPLDFVSFQIQGQNLRVTVNNPIRADHITFLDVTKL